MKLIARFNHIFDKRNYFVGVLLFALSFPFFANAALDVTASVVSKTNTSAVIAIKNNVVSTVGADGQSHDTLAISAAAVRVSDRVEVSQIGEFYSVGKETKNVTFSALSPGTNYEVTFAIYNRTSGEKTSITVPFVTNGQFVPPTTNIPLPVEFLKDKTVLNPNEITLTVSNTSTTDLHVEVFVLGSTGSTVVSDKKDVPAKGTAMFTFSQSILSETTYDVRMIGRKLTETNFNTYTSVDYKGIKTPKVTIVTGGGQAGGTQQTATVSTTRASGKSLTGSTSVGNGTCGDGKDNDGDGKRDWDGVALGGIAQFPPDPACLNPDMTEEGDIVAATSWIPCTNKCDLPSVFVFLNSLIEKLITVILFPISVLMFVYAGYKYITAQGNPSKKADVKKLLRNLIFGIVIILVSWVLVQTALQMVGYTDSLYFF